MTKKWKPGEFEKRTQEVLSEEKKCPYQWYYCSFATKKEFLGALIIQAHGVIECSIRARSLGANPGGELMALPVPEPVNEFLPAEQYRNRLLSKEEVLKLWPDSRSLKEHEEEAKTMKTNRF